MKKIDGLKSSTLKIEADYLDVKIESWNKDYIEVVADYQVNLRRNGEDHMLDVSNKSGGILITSSIDTKNAKKMVIITDEKGNKSYTPIDEWDESKERGAFQSLNFGFEIDGILTVFVPRDMKLSTNTVYGDVVLGGEFEALDLQATYGLIEAKIDGVGGMKSVRMCATYDIVDLTIDKNSDAKLSLQTSYGEVYSDLPLESTNTSHSSSHHGCSSHAKQYILNNGNVPIDIVATYDNIYVRSR